MSQLKGCVHATSLKGSVNFFHRGIKASSVCKAQVFVPVKEKDIDTQGNNQSICLKNLKKQWQMIFFLHFMKGTLKQMSHLRFLLLLTQIKLELQKCGKISVTNVPVFTDLQVQQMGTKTRNRKTNQCGLISARADSQHHISSVLLPELIPSRLTLQ